MKSYGLVSILIFSMVLVGASVGCDAAGPCPAGTCPGPGGRCIPDRPIPPESVGPISMPFDLPVWPTLLKTEFHILPWVSFGTTSVCLPGTGKSIELPTPCFSMKPIPIWIPWLRPLDTECRDCNTPSWIP